MNAIPFAGILAASLLLSACGEARDRRPENRQASEASPATSQAAGVHSGTGTVQSISGNQVAIAHGPVETIGWPAMTMTFTAPEGLAGGLRAGDQVDFSFHQDGGAYVLSSLRKR